MAKEKKIGIRHYLNTRVKPMNPTTKDRFPIYATVTYNRQTTQIPFPIHFNIHGITEQQYNAIFEDKATEYEDVEEVDSDLRKIIRFEASILGDFYHLKGLGTRLNVYFMPISTSFSDVIKNKLSIFFEDYLIVKHHKAIFESKVHLADQLEEIKYYSEHGFYKEQNIIKRIKDEIGLDLSTYFKYVGFEAVGKKHIRKQYKRVLGEYTFYHWLTTDLRDKFKTFISGNEQDLVEKTNSLDYLTSSLVELSSYFSQGVTVEENIKCMDTLLISSFPN